MTNKYDELINIGSQHLANQEYDQAEQVFNQALNLNPNSAISYNNLGMINIIKGNGEKARELLEKCLELDPKLQEAYHNLGSYYTSKQEIDKAEDMYMKSLQIDPNNFNTYHNLATIYIQTEQLSKAKRALEKLLQIDDNNHQSAFILGTIFLTSKEYYPAMANFLYALNLKKDYHDARIGLAEAYYKLGRYKVALKELDELIKAIPEQLTPYVKASLILIELGHNNEAVPLLEKAIEIHSTNLEIIEMLAIIYEQEGNKDRSEELYQEMLILDPENKSASEALERMEKTYTDINNISTVN